MHYEVEASKRLPISSPIETMQASLYYTVNSFAPHNT